MSIFQSIILGIVQGAGEFFPISSTAHLIVIPYFFRWPDPGLGFDVALHLGTLVALLAFFFWDWIAIIYLAFFKNSKFLPRRQAGKIQNSKLQFKIEKFKILYNPGLLWLIIIATIPGVVFGLLLEKKAETIFRNPLLVAVMLALMGLILFLVDKYFNARKDINKISLVDSIIIGFSQAVAIIPGVSRSGATITAGRAMGINRVDAARFSFLLSAPIIFGAFILKLPKLFSEGININIILGIIFSALSGYLAIKYLLKLVEKSSYQIFFWYRLGLAALIVLVYLVR
jgi:undecaprenyl-diphosphatase